MSENIDNLSDEQLADKVIDEFKKEGVDQYVSHAADAKGGLGDTIEKVLGKIGITSERVERIFNVDSGGCGCGARKKFLNGLFPYFNKYKEDNTNE
jgi:hypothetical protein|tara:strand:+ start:485 stop:772 length:288 start_codon:yes stop_codon:yes gene_type:complete